MSATTLTDPLRKTAWTCTKTTMSASRTLLRATHVSTKLVENTAKNDQTRGQTEKPTTLRTKQIFTQVSADLSAHRHTKLAGPSLCCVESSGYGREQLLPRFANVRALFWIFREKARTGRSNDGRLPTDRFKEKRSLLRIRDDAGVGNRFCFEFCWLRELSLVIVFCSVFGF